MTQQEKIQKKANGYGKLAPVFLEGAEFALFNHHWINVEEDLPYNHQDLILNDTEGTETRPVFIVDKSNFERYYIEEMIIALANKLFNSIYRNIFI